MELRNKKLNNIYTKFIGYITKNGKRSVATKLVINSLAEGSFLSSEKSLDILKKIILETGTLIEVRDVKIKKNSFPVPIPTTASRRNYLVIKNLFNSLSGTKARLSTQKKLSQEIVNIVKNKNSVAILNREENLKLAVKNKGNMHFRW